ncbi:MAG TPA: protein-methionine-sulfoxide reductase catalytic subunit MsrP [Candidatus Acidoferrales bacterium]|nr:protein-methionine-sulfoxide reductase catalytic subunit MsrP [Candidatus Acidoferrales bacterium]
MLVRNRKLGELPYSEVTPKQLYVNRRQFIATAAGAGAVALGAGKVLELLSPTLKARAAGKLQYSQSSLSTHGETLTPQQDITHYNNFYEFSTDKEGPAQFAGSFKPLPWEVSVEGNVAKPQKFDYDSLLKLAPLEERIYRHRCVEGWSMVIPWIGFPMKALIDRVQPTSKAKFVEFVTVERPSEMPGQRSQVLDWPYVEGLRLDEAQNPLALFVVGLYGDVLPNQNGAPFRAVIPWKYGFKSGKSIVKIRFVEQMPETTWNKANPREYGFYSNVNPQVDHPRWSQARERRIGELFKRDTLMFNGYGEWVASLYTGMDLRKYY